MNSLRLTYFLLVRALHIARSCFGLSTLADASPPLNSGSRPLNLPMLVCGGQETKSMRCHSHPADIGNSRCRHGRERGFTAASDNGT